MPEARFRSRSRLLWAGAVLCLAAVVAFLVLAVSVALQPGSTGSSPPTTLPPALGAGTPAPSFDLPRLGGPGRVTLATARGRPVVLNFFASWCTDCQQELSAFAAASKHFAGKVDFIGIDTSETDPPAALALMRRAGDTYPTGVSAGEAVADAYLVGALPETFFIDARGRVESFVPGKETLAGLVSGAAALLHPRR